MREIIKKIIPQAIINRFHEHKHQKNLQRYAGNNVICPICNSSFRAFAPYLNRENARCLNCESLERHRLLWKYLQEKTDIFRENKKIKLLHFAPEKMFYNIFSNAGNIIYYPCDISPEHYAYSGSVDISKADITNIPFEDNYFDVVFCNHVLEHIPDDRQALSELYRVMNCGAWGIFQVPIDFNREKTYEDITITTSEGREKAFGFADHVRYYGRDYKERLSKTGFKVTEDEYIKSFSPADKLKYGLDSSELIYKCIK
jgi:SAM-dependent methyltransferase